MSPIQTVLIVDDEPADRYLMGRLLQLTGRDLDVHEAAHGQAALDFLQGRSDHAHDGIVSPVLVLLDINMPVMTGFEMLERLADPDLDLRHEPLVVTILTSSQYQGDIDRATAHDVVHDYLVKYPDEAQLVDLIDRSALAVTS